MKRNIEVEISEIDVNWKYYSFKYKVTIDGKVRKEGTYSGSHTWYEDPDGWKKELETGDYAIATAIDQALND